MVTIKQEAAFKETVKNGGNVSEAMRTVGYAETTVHNPDNLTQSDGWKKLVDEYLSDQKLSEVHAGLLASTRLDHMVFPLGPKENGEVGIQTDDIGEDGIHVAVHERMKLSDEDIKEMLAEVNCKVRRIVHGETARHVYFWAADNKARKEALDMAYKLKGKYAPEKRVTLNLGVEPSQEILEAAEILNAHFKRDSSASDGNEADALGLEAQNKDGDGSTD